MGGGGVGGGGVGGGGMSGVEWREVEWMEVEWVEVEWVEVEWVEVEWIVGKRSVRGKLANGRRVLRNSSYGVGSGVNDKHSGTNLDAVSDSEPH